MRSSGTRIFLLFLAGPIVALIVAWVCVLWSPNHTTKLPPAYRPGWALPNGIPSLWPAYAEHGVGINRAVYISVKDRFTTGLSADVADVVKAPRAEIWSAGWPWPAFTLERRSIHGTLRASEILRPTFEGHLDHGPTPAGADPTVARPGNSWDGVDRTPWPRRGLTIPSGLAAALGARPGRPLPVWPLWPGLAADSMVLLALIASVHFGPGLVRRALLLRQSFRTRRDLCPACAYPVGVSERCTECGVKVTPKPAQTL
jgi:hypothetical protein